MVGNSVEVKVDLSCRICRGFELGSGIPDERAVEVAVGQFPCGKCYKTFYRRNLITFNVFTVVLYIKGYYSNSYHRLAVNYHS